MFIPPTFALLAFVHAEQVGDVGTEPYVWTMGAIVGDPADVQPKLDDLMEAWGDHMATTTTSDLFLQHITATVPAPGGGTGSIQSTAEPVQGELVGAPTYLSMAAKVYKHTARLGRKGRGVFHPPGALLLNEITNAGVLAEAARTRISEACNDFIGAWPAIGLAATLLHSSEADGSPDTITGLTVGSSVGIIRKRIL